MSKDTPKDSSSKKSCEPASQEERHTDTALVEKKKKKKQKDHASEEPENATKQKRKRDTQDGPAADEPSNESSKKKKQKKDKNLDGAESKVQPAVADETTLTESKKEKKKRKRDRTEPENADSTTQNVSEETEMHNPKDSESKKEKKEKKRRRKEQAASGETSQPSPPASETPTPSVSSKPIRTPATSRPTTVDVEAFLSKNSITIHTPAGVESKPPILQFSQLDIPAELAEAFSGFKEPSPIQACSWPYAMAGKDVVGIAETGSGKTLAFGIPALTKLIANPSSSSKSRKSTISVLVVAPTRELAFQTHETLSALGKPFGIASVAVFGGVPKEPQVSMLKNAMKAKNGLTTKIIVGTPGRILDLMNDGACDLSGVDYLVLDEADRMLDKGFENDIRNIIAQTKPLEERQTMMFSATWPEAVRRLARSFQRDPVRVTVGSDDLTANSRVEQVVEVLDDGRQKDQRLLSVLKSLSHKKTTTNGAAESRILVFALYKKEASRVEQMLRRQGYAVGAIHGDMSQNARMETLENFKNGTTGLMVATDVAARGLDIPNVGAVINYTFPLTIEDYIHRIGRTGRGGKSGKSITFFTGENHERALAGEFARVLREGGFDNEALKKFPMTIKKKEHGAYGAFYRDDIPVPKGPTKISPAQLTLCLQVPPSTNNTPTPASSPLPFATSMMGLWNQANSTLNRVVKPRGASVDGGPAADKAPSDTEPDDTSILDENEGSIISSLISQLRQVFLRILSLFKATPLSNIGTRSHLIHRATTPDNAFNVHGNRVGMDLSRVTFPTFVLEPRSMLERITDFMSHPDLIFGAEGCDDPEERFIRVLQYYLAGWHIKPKGVKKPYNPVLGEFFRCRYDYPNGTQGFYVAEQVSHHPPISAFYYVTPANHVSIIGELRPKSKFLGNSVSTTMEGENRITLLGKPDDGEYVITMPNMYARGILFGKMVLELGDTCIAKNEKHGLYCDLEFKTKGFFSGTYNALVGRLRRSSTEIGEVSGRWSHVMEIKSYKTGQKRVLFDAVKDGQNVCPKWVPPEDEQQPNESQRLWRHLTAAIIAKDMEQATTAKTAVEEGQREQRRKNEEAKVEHVPRFFELKGGQWVPKIKLPADPVEATRVIQEWIFPASASQMPGEVVPLPATGGLAHPIP